jgi:hypothetical protein
VRSLVFFDGVWSTSDLSKSSLYSTTLWPRGGGDSRVCMQTQLTILVICLGSVYSSFTLVSNYAPIEMEEAYSVRFFRACVGRSHACVHSLAGDISLTVEDIPFFSLGDNAYISRLCFFQISCRFNSRIWWPSWIWFTDDNLKRNLHLIFFRYNGDAQEKVPFHFWCDPDTVAILNFGFQTITWEKLHKLI